ncbi:MAG TPA: ankyrin repeat domain-containing protein, partial [Opitutales bacterium]|nr:ankyrin repeat domain-containing protein [Opitutales bacterium]
MNKKPLQLLALLISLLTSPLIAQPLQNVLNTPAANGLTVLMQAAKIGDLERLDPLLQQGADIRIRTMLDWTALDFAIEQGRPDVANLLIQTWL